MYIMCTVVTDRKNVYLNSMGTCVLRSPVSYLPLTLWVSCIFIRKIYRTDSLDPWPSGPFGSKHKFGTEWNLGLSSDITRFVVFIDWLRYYRMEWTQWRGTLSWWKRLFLLHVLSLSIEEKESQEELQSFSFHLSQPSCTSVILHFIVVNSVKTYHNKTILVLCIRTLLMFYV